MTFLKSRVGTADIMTIVRGYYITIVKTYAEEDGGDTLLLNTSEAAVVRDQLNEILS